MPDLRTICCTVCGGDRGFEVWTGYDPRDGQPTGYFDKCDACEGTGDELVRVQPIELADLDLLSQ